MNFFDAQDRARRSSRRLVLVYLLATALIVAAVTAVSGIALYFSQMQYGVSPRDFALHYAPLLSGVAVLTALFIGGATLYKTASLSSGGRRVAEQLGGTPVSPDVRDPLRRRLVNVVEEMSIASGVPVPEIYVLEQEAGINAFAAGFAPEDAAIAVTRGTLEILDRDELQGVIAHEFSHILNGDMRLNIRLMGILFGIMALGLVGRMVLRGGRYGALASSRRGRGAPAVLIIGLSLAVLGAIGVFFSRLIKAGVSRERERLADASAVQFTRQANGIAGALKKIGGFDSGSYIRAADPEEVSHMLFSPGAKLAGLFATHPPLTERIRALDPSFDPADYPVIGADQRDAIARDAATESSTGGARAGFASAAAAVAAVPLTESVGRPDEAQIEYAARLRASIPPALYDAAHSQELSYLLAVSLILDRNGRVLELQLGLVRERLGDRRTGLVRQFHEQLQESGFEYRLPLLEVAFPALKRRPRPQLDYLVDLARRLIEIDGRVDLYEFCFYRVLVTSLEHAHDPSRQPKPEHLGRSDVREAAISLLGAVARHGHRDEATARAAFRAGTRLFGRWAQDSEYDPAESLAVSSLDRDLDVLRALNGDGRRLVVDAVGDVVGYDNELTVTEAELLRAVCATLDCPLPPVPDTNLASGNSREPTRQSAYD